MRYTKQQIFELTGEDIDSDYGYIEVLSETSKVRKEQSKLFHALLDLFWKSGCSSFESKRDLRWHYKRAIGLIEIKYEPCIDKWTEKCLREAIKILPLEDNERYEAKLMLEGKVCKEHSWAEARKENATEAINMIINDMFEARVDEGKFGKEFKEILDGIE